MQHIIVGTTSPSTAPTRLGQHYIDTASGTVYMSAGTSSPSDWKPSTSLTNEQIQDVIGPMFSSSGAISVVYNDASNLIEITLNQSLIDHVNLVNKGSNTHAQLDAHLASIANPHSTTKAQVGLSDVANLPLATDLEVQNKELVDKYVTLKQVVNVTGDKISKAELYYLSGGR